MGFLLQDREDVWQLSTEKDFVLTLQQAFCNRSVTADDVVQFDIDRELIVGTFTHCFGYNENSFLMINP